MAEQIGETATGAELWDEIPPFLPQEWGNLEWLEEQPVLEEGQAHDLKYQFETLFIEVAPNVREQLSVRVWHARTSLEDGEPFKETVEVEVKSSARSWHDRWCFPAL